MQKEYDVVIVGGGTSGCACAWNSARQGLKTLLIEQKNFLGGAITAQLVVPAMKTDHRFINTEFFEALIKEAHARNAQITYEDGNPGWFNPLKLPEILHDMLKSVGSEVLLKSKPLNIYFDKKDNDNKKIISLCIDTNYTDNKFIQNYIDKKHNDNAKANNNQKINAKYFIDATGDANLSKISGADFLPFEKFQAASLRFIMGGIDKKAFSEWLLSVDRNRDVTTACTVEDEIHLSTACTWDNGPNWALKPIFDKAVSQGVLKDSDRAYFQVFSIPGEADKIAFNCPRIVSDKDFNPLNLNDKISAYKCGVETIKRLESFCREYFPGFKNAYIYKIADDLGVRESRRVKGEYVLTKEDIYNAKNFKNAVAYSNYPIDVHSVKKDDFILDYVQKTYAVPLESLKVKGFDNLFVVGRCLSADFYAQAAVRIQPTCFSMGEGVAKYICKLL